VRGNLPKKFLVSSIRVKSGIFEGYEYNNGGHLYDNYDYCTQKAFLIRNAKSAHFVLKRCSSETMHEGRMVWSQLFDPKKDGLAALEDPLRQLLSECHFIIREIRKCPIILRNLRVVAPTRIWHPTYYAIE
jgi:hypothetical protein